MGFCGGDNDLDEGELRPCDFPGWMGVPITTRDPKGEARELWRNISYHCGDHFADWVLEVCRKRVDPWGTIRAANAVLEIDDHLPTGDRNLIGGVFGTEARLRVAAMLLPDIWDEEKFKVADFFTRRK